MLDALIDGRKNVVSTEKKVCYAMIGIFVAVIVIGTIALICVYVL